MKRRISWVGRSLKDFQRFPVAVQDQITFALQLAASGATPDNAKPMKGLGTGVFEIALRHRTDGFCAVYAVQLGDALYVVHAFQKKSKSGIKTPKPDVDVIRQRLKRLKEELQ